MDADLQLKAKVILNETPENKEQGLAELRSWIKENENVFKCPNNEDFLVRFLRQGKYRQEPTRRRLKLYISLISCEYKGRPDWFNPLPLSREEFGLFIAAKTLLPLGHAQKNGPFILLGRLSDFDESKFERKMILQSWIMFAIWLTTQSSVQVNGISFISDLKDVNMAMFMKFYDMKDTKNISSFLQDAIPMRIEHLFLFREPQIISVIYPIIEPLIHENIRARLFRVKDDISQIEIKLEGIWEVLPKEYGGKGPTIDQISATSQETLLNFWAKHDEKFEWHKEKPNMLKDLMRLMKLVYG